MDFGFWDFGDFGFWIVGILDFGFWILAFGILGILDFGDFGFWLLGFWGFLDFGDFGFWGFWGFWNLGIWDFGDFGFWGFRGSRTLDFGILGRSRGCTTRQFAGGQRLESPLVCLWGPLQNQLYLIDLGQESKLNIFSEIRTPQNHRKTLTSNPEVRTLRNHRKTQTSNPLQNKSRRAQ